MNQMPSPAQARDQLVDDMKAVIDDAQELLDATAGAAGERIRAARARAEERIQAAKQKLADLDLIGHAKDAVRTSDDYVHEHPWRAVGIAAAAGLLVGIIVSRR